jgi:hypothetical protein
LVSGPFSFKHDNKDTSRKYKADKYLNISEKGRITRRFVCQSIKETNKTQWPWKKGIANELRRKSQVRLKRILFVRPPAGIMGWLMNIWLIFLTSAWSIASLFRIHSEPRRIDYTRSAWKCAPSRKYFANGRFFTHIDIAPYHFRHFQSWSVIKD